MNLDLGSWIASSHMLLAMTDNLLFILEEHNFYYVLPKVDGAYIP